jgi:hypothetical protein
MLLIFCGLQIDFCLGDKRRTQACATRRPTDEASNPKRTKYRFAIHNPKHKAPDKMPEKSSQAQDLARKSLTLLGVGQLAMAATLERRPWMLLRMTCGPGTQPWCGRTHMSLGRRTGGAAGVAAGMLVVLLLGPGTTST